MKIFRLILLKEDSINFNDYIWDLGKKICVTDCFNIRPFAGLQYLHIGQSYSIKTLGSNILVQFGAHKTKIDTKYSRHWFARGI